MKTERKSQRKKERKDPELRKGKWGAKGEGRVLVKDAPRPSPIPFVRIRKQMHIVHIAHKAPRFSSFFHVMLLAMSLTNHTSCPQTTLAMVIKPVIYIRNSSIQDPVPTQETPAETRTAIMPPNETATAVVAMVGRDTALRRGDLRIGWDPTGGSRGRGTNVGLMMSEGTVMASRGSFPS